MLLIPSFKKRLRDCYSYTLMSFFLAFNAFVRRTRCQTKNVFKGLTFQNFLSYHFRLHEFQYGVQVIYIASFSIPPSSSISPRARHQYLVIIAIPRGERRVVGVVEDVFHTLPIFSKSKDIASWGTQHPKIVILGIYVKKGRESNSQNILPFKRYRMNVYVSKPIPKARFPEADLVRNPVSIRVKGRTVTLLNQDPSAVRPIHLTPHPNVALAFRQWGDIMFVYIIKTCRASSMREKSHAAFSLVKNDTWWN